MTDEEVFELKELLDDLRNARLNANTQDRIQKAIISFNSVYESMKTKSIKRKYEKLKFCYSDFSPLREAAKIVNVASSSIALLSAAQQDIDFLDKATQDILHALELADLTDEQERELTKDLKELRRVRRICKNFIELVSPLSQFSTQHKETLGKLQKIYTEIKKTQDSIESRRYYPRVKIELSPLFEQKEILEAAK